MSDLADPRVAPGEDTRAAVKAALFGGTPPSKPTGPRKIGRFEITGELGRGGMGQVLAGFDHELERRVAVKLLHAEIGKEHAVRLRREAKALAKLSHPNVVQVYEVGTHDDQMFIAMEYVEGQTLRAWLQQDQAPLEALLRMFIAAGRGLAAAHGEGLIHRDFKPDNVIVGVNGRPRILDFGLARAEQSGDDGAGGLDPELVDAAVTGLDDTLAAALTATGVLLGTPAYMAPEQLRAEPTSEATDQFSYCVALWEALYGARPFQGKNMRTLALAVCAGEVAHPSTGRGPQRLRLALERGLSVDPDRRWPTMQALLDELEGLRTRPERRRRGILFGGALTVAVGAMGWAALRSPEREIVETVVTPDGPCAPVAERFDGIWDDATVAELEVKYGQGPSVAQLWWQVEKRFLTGYVQDWTRIYADSCEGGEAERDRLTFELRKSCLDKRLVEVKTRVALMQRLDAKARVVSSSAEHPPYFLASDCENDKVVAAVVLLPSDAEVREEVLAAILELRVALGAVTAAFSAGTAEDFGLAYAAGRAAVARIEAAEFPPAIAEARMLEGNGILAASMDSGFGFARLREASKIARDSRSEFLFVLSELFILRHQSAREDPRLASSEVLRDFEDWESALLRVGAPAVGMSKLLVLRASHHAIRGERELAIADSDEAIRWVTAAFGEDSPVMLKPMGNVVEAFGRTGMYDDARIVHRRLIETIERLYGDVSLELAQPLETMALHDLAAGELGDALAGARRSVHIASMHYQANNGAAIMARVVLGHVHMARGEFDQAGRLLAELAPFADALSAGRADIWARLQLTYTAVAGMPDPLTRIAAAKDGLYSDQEELGEFLQPLLSGQSDRAAAAELTKRLPEVQSEIVRCVIEVQRGRLLARIGSHAEAAEAFSGGLACPRDSEWGRSRAVEIAASLGRIQALRAVGEDETAAGEAATLEAALVAIDAEHPLLGQVRNE